MNPLVIVGGVAISIIFIWFITRNKILLFWFSFIAVFLPTEFINRFFISLPFIVKSLPHLILIGCTGLTIVFYKKTRQTVPVNLIWLYILMLMVALFSMFYNETTIGELVYAQRGYIFVICLVIVFKTIYTKYTLDDLYAFIVKAGLLMTAVALFQRVVLVSILHIWTGDIITGTFGSDAQYLLYQLVCIIIVIAYWLAGKKLISLSPSNTLLIFIGSIAIANKKAGILYIIAILLLFAYQVGYKMLFQHLGKMVYLLFFIFIAAFTFEYFYKTIYGNKGMATNYSYIMDTDYMMDYLFGDDTAEGKFNKGEKLRRGAASIFAYDLIERDPFTLLLGMGPGSTHAGGYLDIKYTDYRINRNAFSWLLAETGFLGLIIYFCMLLSIYFWRIVNGRKEHKIIKNIIVLLLFLYTPYENAVLMLPHALIISVIIFPNLERYFTKTKEANNISEDELQPSSYFATPPVR